MVSKKISFLIPKITEGGIERIFVEVSNYIIQHSTLKVEFFLNDASKSSNHLLNNKIKLFKYNNISYKKYLIFLIKYFNSSKPDIVFSSLYIIGFSAIIARFFSKHKPKIMFGAHNALSHKIANPDNNKDKYFLRILSKFFLNFADRVISASDGVGKELVDKFNLKKEKQLTIPGPTLAKVKINSYLKEKCDHKFFKLKNYKIIICVGRLSPQKGYDILLKSFFLFQKKYKSKLLIIGTGSERKNLNNLVKRLGLINHVSFMGYQKNPFKFIVKSDLFVSASRWEGLSLAILDALYSGTNVVSSNCNYGPSEILENGRYGILRKINSVRDLYLGMIYGAKKIKSTTTKIKNMHRAEIYFRKNSNQKYLDLINSFLN